MLVLTRGDTSAAAPSVLLDVMESYGLGRTQLAGITVIGSGFRGGERHSSIHGLVFTAIGMAVISVQEVQGQSGYLFAPAHGSWTVGGQMVQLRDEGSNPCGSADAGLKALVSTLRRGGIDPGYVQSLIVVNGELSGVAQPETERGAGVVVVKATPDDVIEGVGRATVQVAGGLAQLWTSADVLAALKILGVDTSLAPTEAITNERFPYSPYVLRPTQLDEVPGEDDWGRPAVTVARPAAAHAADTNTVPGMALLGNVAPAAPAAGTLRPVASGVGRAPGRPEPDFLTPDEPGAPATRRPLRWVAALAVLLVIGVGVVFGARALFSSDATSDGSQAGPQSTPTSTVAGESTPAPAPQTLGAFTMAFGDAKTTKDCAAHARGQVQQYLATTKCTTMKRALFLTTSEGRQIVVSVADVTMADDPAAAGLKKTLDSNDTGNVNTLLAEGVFPSGYPQSDLFVNGQAYSSKQNGAVVRIVESAWADGGDSAPGDATEQVAEAGLAAKLP